MFDLHSEVTNVSEGMALPSNDGNDVRPALEFAAHDGVYRSSKLFLNQ